ncbi:MAG: hypothetical protein R2836_09985, partial [Chitinophagales bacterium]
MYAQPANDNPCGAITLNVGSSCNYSTYTTVGATYTSSPSATCGYYSSCSSRIRDVWFKFTVSSSSPTFISTSALGLTDGVIEIFSGNVCGGTGTLITCIDDGSQGTMPDYLLNGVPIGTEIYIRFYSYQGGYWFFGTSCNSANTGTFGLCVSTSLCNGVDIPGQSCATATPICDLNGLCGRTSEYYTVDTWSSLTNSFNNCGGASIENNSFISFIAAASTVNLNVTVSNCYDGDGIQMFVFTAPSCGGSVTSIFCGGSGSVGLTGSNNLTFTGLTPYNTYYLMFDGFAGDVCDYTINVDGGSGILLPVDAGSDKTICVGSSTT